MREGRGCWGKRHEGIGSSTEDRKPGRLMWRILGEGGCVGVQYLG